MTVALLGSPDDRLWVCWREQTRRGQPLRLRRPLPAKDSP
jgi:hypothetical protein